MPLFCCLKRPRTINAQRLTTVTSIVYCCYELLARHPIETAIFHLLFYDCSGRVVAWKNTRVESSSNIFCRVRLTLVIFVMTFAVSGLYSCVGVYALCWWIGTTCGRDAGHTYTRHSSSMEVSYIVHSSPPPSKAVVCYNEQYDRLI